MDAADHKMAVRIYGGQLKVDEIATPNGKQYMLINLPYYVAAKVEDYLGLYWNEDH